MLIVLDDSLREKFEKMGNALSQAGVGTALSQAGVGTVASFGRMVMKQAATLQFEIMSHEAGIRMACMTEEEANQIIALCEQSKDLWHWRSAHDALVSGIAPDEVRYWFWQRGITLQEEFKTGPVDKQFLK